MSLPTPARRRAIDDAYVYATAKADLRADPNDAAVLSSPKTPYRPFCAALPWRNSPWHPWQPEISKFDKRFAVPSCPSPRLRAGAPTGRGVGTNGATPRSRRRDRLGACASSRSPRNSSAKVTPRSPGARERVTTTRSLHRPKDASALDRSQRPDVHLAARLPRRPRGNVPDRGEIRTARRTSPRPRRYTGTWLRGQGAQTLPRPREADRLPIGVAPRSRIYFVPSDAVDNTLYTNGVRDAITSRTSGSRAIGSTSGSTLPPTSARPSWTSVSAGDLTAPVHRPGCVTTRHRRALARGERARLNATSLLEGRLRIPTLRHRSATRRYELRPCRSFCSVLAWWRRRDSARRDRAGLS